MELLLSEPARDRLADPRLLGEAALFVLRSPDKPLPAGLAPAGALPPGAGAPPGAGSPPVAGSPPRAWPAPPSPLSPLLVPLSAESPLSSSSFCCSRIRMASSSARAVDSSSPSSGASGSGNVEKMLVFIMEKINSDRKKSLVFLLVD